MDNLINQFETIQIIEQQEESYQNYNFLCKCDERCSSFTDFENHVRENHNCQDLTVRHLTRDKNNSEWKIKYFWTLNCPNRKCLNKFSSSLCNADLKIRNNNIEIVKKRKLQCKKCKNYASFDHEILLDKFLKERVKQKLIYSKYKRNFEQYNRGKVQDAKNWKVTSNLCVKSVKN